VISALAAFSATVVFGLYEGVSLGENTGLVFGVLAAATAVGAGLGVALARLWAWRWRWIGGVLLGVLFGIAAWYATLYVALSAAGGR
jgi:predicted MFS family arabinose efflux permease